MSLRQAQHDSTPHRLLLLEPNPCVDSSVWLRASTRDCYVTVDNWALAHQSFEPGDLLFMSEYMSEGFMSVPMMRIKVPRCPASLPGTIAPSHSIEHGVPVPVAPGFANSSLGERQQTKARQTKDLQHTDGSDRPSQTALVTGCATRSSSAAAGNMPRNSRCS